MTSAQAAYYAWNQEALQPSLNPSWVNRDNRLFRYELAQAYVNSNPYGNALHNKRRGLYKFIRDVMGIPAPLVELYVGEVYGGSLDLKNLERGAIPIETEHDALRQQLIQLYRNSNWQSEKSLYVRHGATFGDVAVKVVDNRMAQQVYLEVLHPAKIHTLERDNKGDVVYVRIEYERGDVNPVTGNIESTYTYREDITPEEFRTFKDDKPFSYVDDAIGRPAPAWRNDYGFVPLEVVQHRDIGKGFGVSSFHHVMRQLDEINDAWSLLNDNVRKAVEVIWFMKARKSDIDITRNERDQVPIIYGGKEAGDPFAMISGIDITAAGQNILNMANNLDRSLPEYALQKVRETGNMTAPGIRAGWSDAIDKIVEARGNYDGGLVKFNKMGVFIGAMMRYPGFEGQQYTSIEDERLEHNVAERPVIEDQITEKERLDMLRNLPDKPEQARLVLEALHVPEDKIDAITAEIQEARQQQQMQQLQSGFGNNGNTPPPQLPAGQGNAPPQPGAGDDVESEVQRILELVNVA